MGENFRESIEPPLPCATISSTVGYLSSLSFFSCCFLAAASLFILLAAFTFAKPNFIRILISSLEKPEMGEITPLDPKSYFQYCNDYLTGVRRKSHGFVICFVTSSYSLPAQHGRQCSYKRVSISLFPSVPTGWPIRCRSTNCFFS